MMHLPPDPLEAGGIPGFGERLRSGETTAEKVTTAYIDRIAALDGRLQAYEHVAGDAALAAARSVDRLLAAGTDLGPLMGVPVAIKDIVAVDGMPTTAGSMMDVADLIGPEGGFVKMLKRAGCVILGKVKTTEFAIGTLLGINQVRGTPWNPWDAETHRIPGSSSSGSGVATAAGLCGFAIGSDTGGSVRIPAAFNGIVGLKTTKGVWPTDGVFPLCPTFDTLSTLTRTAADAAVVAEVLIGGPRPVPAPARGLRLGQPSRHFFDKLDPEVEADLEKAVALLHAAGVEIVPFEVPEIHEADEALAAVMPAELIASLGRQRFLAGRDRMDTEAEMRAAPGLDVMADQYTRLVRRHHAVVEIYRERMRGLDGWLAPSAPMLPMAVEEATTPEGRRRLTEDGARTTRHTNFLGLCSVSVPVQGLGARLPVGLQINARGFGERGAIGAALSLETLMGPPRMPDLSGFATQGGEL